MLLADYKIPPETDIKCHMQSEEIQAMIQQGLPDAEVQVSGDGRHFDAVVVSEAFAGKGLLEQHRLVYATLGDKMGGDIHALTIRTYTHEQWAQANA
jgi:acid stress-induced BolA-like protein IbaG/YrbA